MDTPNEVPKDSSFVKELEYCHLIVVVFFNKRGELDLGVWGYRNPNDAARRFERIVAIDKDNVSKGFKSPLIHVERFMVGMYENFEQSLFGEVGDDDPKNRKLM